MKISSSEFCFHIVCQNLWFFYQKYVCILISTIKHLTKMINVDQLARFSFCFSLEFVVSDQSFAYGAKKIFKNLKKYYNFSKSYQNR